MILRLSMKNDDFDADFAAFLALPRGVSRDGDDVNDVVTKIIAKVKTEGDAALCALTAHHDNWQATPETLRVTEADIDAAEKSCDAETLEALDMAATRIAAFHARQKPHDDSYTDAAGVTLGHRWTPIQAAGLYVPGGTASYPSSVLMNAIPAKIAGVERLVMTVPNPDGVLNPLVLAAAKRAGVDEIYRVGGAQAIAALAYGTKTIAQVDVIVGPGNAYVAAAKRQVFGQVGIDMIAGPSEILVVADSANDPDWIAADLLSQAEHDEVAQSILITDQSGFGDAVAQAVEAHLKTLPREAIARASWKKFGAIIEVENIERDAPPLIDRLAPEHVELAVADPQALMAKFSHAGAIFMGRYTPEAIGDYIAGPNHVLPTSRAARYASGLSVLDFMKRSSLITCDADSLARIGPNAVRLAKAEGLDAHADSISIRLNK